MKTQQDYRILTIRQCFRRMRRPRPNPLRRHSMKPPASLARRLLTGATFALAALAVHAQDYPAKPVRIIAPFPAGSGPDANAREIAAELTKVLGQSFFVENRPGASNIIGTEAAAKAPADGYSLYIGTT